MGRSLPLLRRARQALARAAAVLRARPPAKVSLARLSTLTRVVAATATDAAEVLVGTIRLLVRRPLAAQNLRAERARVAHALHSSDERYRGLFLHAPYGICTVTVTGRLLAANWALALLLGYGAVDEVLAFNSRDFYDVPDDWERVRARWREEGPAAAQEVRWRRRDGHLLTVCLTGRRVIDASTREETFEVFVQNVTEERRLEGAIRHAQKMEAVGRLAAGIAHDFNNLLTAILGYSELVLEQLDADKPIYADLQEIRKAGQNAASLTHQLLAFARKQTLRLEVVDVNAIVRASEKLIRRTIGETVQLVVRLAPSIAAIKADPVELEQALLNLAFNARDAMPAGGTLTIETSNATSDDVRAMPWSAAVVPGRYIRVTVTDTGVGMDADTRARIFEPFFTTKGPGRGTGLGLAMVQGMATQLKGHVWVDSEPQMGSSFTVFIPVTDSVATASGPSLVDGGIPIGREKILVVEDEPGVRALAVSMLTRHGYHVLEAATPSAAMALVAEGNASIDLVLTDVVMPEMLGPALVTVLRAQSASSFRVIYMSGYASEDASVSLALESETFIAKPFKQTELLRTVRWVLDRVGTPPVSPQSPVCSPGVRADSSSQ